MTDLSLPLSRTVLDAAPQPFSELVSLVFDRPDLISLAAGLVDYDTLPGKPVAPLVKDILGDPAAARAALQYGPTVGFAGFREQLYDHMATLDGAALDSYPGSAEDVVVTTGSQELLNLIADALIDRGDVVIAGWPSYFVYMTALTTFGATIRGVDLDEHGLCPDKLDRLLSGLYAAGQIKRVKFLYVVSYYQNPTGITLAEERRGQILGLVRHWSEKAGHR
ncbi:MAG: aminotransferase class I/II-fold pyridoxal phosphate-dependent enzyme, partial [Planctomycetota bacterium]